ncbi:MAG: helix-turn-helix domain-containing protein [Oscillospiraceae bacterium]|jgi:AraC-like DNA-binding protein|nr:helix-turn-helix domain-containing protein [Oscillospiraceae bacterium]
MQGGRHIKEYLSAREAAQLWGLSERRVHTLCEEGRIEGLIRLGRAWGIPRDAKRPTDERARRRGGADSVMPADIKALIALLGSDATLSFHRDGFAVFQLENDTGNGIITIYDVFPGIRLFYNDLHMSYISDHDSIPLPSTSDILEVNHCREGRFECELKNGECAYLGEGDLSLLSLQPILNTSRFPLSHYHGVSLLIDIPRASRSLDELSELLGTVPIDLYALKDRLLADRPYFIMRGTESVEHVFSELYSAPEPMRESYIKLKAIELLIFLSAAEPDSGGTRHYFYKTRVDAVKAMHRYMTSHMDEPFTLESLSERFGIPLTAMKTCFKSVFGAPIQAYMREYRLQAAAVRLRETDDSIADIAAGVGYDSHARFSSAFRAVYGASPTDYRKISVRKR